MIKQIVLTVKEYAEIEKMQSEYAEIKKQLSTLKNVNAEFEKFKKIVAEMFLNEKGQYDYMIRSLPNRVLFLNEEILTYLFNYFHKEKFYNETRLD